MQKRAGLFIASLVELCKARHTAFCLQSLIDMYDAVGPDRQKNCLKIKEVASLGSYVDCIP